jgi:hypothetical protein
MDYDIADHHALHDARANRYVRASNRDIWHNCMPNKNGQNIAQKIYFCYLRDS